MASAKTRAVGSSATVAAHPLCAALSRRLTATQREPLARHLRSLLGWQRRIRSWPSLAEGADATPFVTVYAGGVLRGCFGSHEGPPGERVTRAFLRALEDSRYGGVRPEERERLAVVLSYVRAIRLIDPERVAEQLAAGTEGIGVTKEGRPPVLLLPHVARHMRAGPRELLAALAQKAGLSDWRDANVFAVTTENIVVRSGERSDDPAPTPAAGARAAAAAWLARLVGSGGAVTFAIDARQRRLLPTGTMHHGRAAVALRAMKEHGGHARCHAAGAKAWLEGAIDDALRGQPIEGWPREPAVAAGTLALAHMAGVDVRRALAEVAREDTSRASPWHAAQVVAALGLDAPEALWRACTDDLVARPWAPWTLLAARSRRDSEIADRAARALCESIRAAPPHEGGCGVVPVPETAVTALVVEALDGLPDAQARHAVTRGRAFLRRWQLVEGTVPALLDPSLACGAFLGFARRRRASLRCRRPRAAGDGARGLSSSELRRETDR